MIFYKVSIGSWAIGAKLSKGGGWIEQTKFFVLFTSFGDNFAPIGQEPMGNLLCRGPSRGQHAGYIQKPGRTRVVHYHYCYDI